MYEQHYTRFKDISVSERILNTVFLLTIGLGYLMALTNMYFMKRYHRSRIRVVQLYLLWYVFLISIYLV